MTDDTRQEGHYIDLKIEIEELEAKIAPDGGEIVLPIPFQPYRKT